MECRSCKSNRLEQQQTTSGFETTNNPTATRVTLISPTTRHLIHFGTETTIGSHTTQDDMFIRFSVDEDINNYTLKQLTLQAHKDYKMVQKLWVH